MTKPYLKNIVIESFGSLQNVVIQNLSPELSVLYGKNEAGKTTIAQCIKGVFYGWPESRGGNNSYKPKSGLRSASLQFHVKHQDLVLERVKNNEGLLGSSDLIAAFSQLDKDTYESMFLLTSDSLKELKKTHQLSDRLLTASTGTIASPAEALRKVESELKNLVSRSQDYPLSLTNLKDRHVELTEALQDVQAKTDQFLGFQRELESLVPELQESKVKKSQIEESLKLLAQYQSELHDAERTITSLTDTLERESQALDAQTQTTQQLYQEGGLSLERVSESLERTLTESVNKLAKEKDLLEHRMTLAREDYITAEANYQAFCEQGKQNIEGSTYKHKRNIQKMLSVVFSLSFLSAGSLFVLYGRQVSSFSFAELGVALIICALLIAVGSLVMLFRTKDPEQLFQEEDERYHWIYLQDKQKYEITRSEYENFCLQIAADFPELTGIYEVFSLEDLAIRLQDLKERRLKWRMEDMKRTTLEAQKRTSEAKLQEAERKKSQVLRDLDPLLQISLEPKHAQAQLNDLIQEKRDYLRILDKGILELTERKSTLETILSQAAQDKTINKIKLEIAQVNTRIAESKERFALLLLAREALRESVESWQSCSQPEVYRQASEFFSIMTNGDYRQVLRNEKNQLEVETSYLVRKSPNQLSLSTVQQLYLSLRMALLLTASDVGPLMPIVADDILVHFDEERRLSAAKCLARLAQERQLIFFTCHRDIAELMHNASENSKLIEL